MAQLIARATGTAVRRAGNPFGLPLHVGSDLLLICVGFWLAYLLRYEYEVGGEVSRAVRCQVGDRIVPLKPSGTCPVGAEVLLPDFRYFDQFLPVMFLLGGVLLAVFAARGLYRLPRWTSFLDEAMLIGSGAITGFGALIVIVFYVRQLYFSRLVFLYALAIVTALLIAKRLARHSLQAWMRSRGRWVDRVLVIGAGPAGERVMGALMGQPRLGYRLVGFVEDAPTPPGWAIATARGVGRPERLGAGHDLPEILRRFAIDEVIVALPSTAHDRLYWTIERCREARIPFTLLPDLFELSLDRITIHELNGLPLISLKDSGIRGWNFALKRAFDVVVSAAALIASFIPMIVIAILIRLDSPGPVIFGQTRIGRNGEPFTFYKFRSMYQNADNEKARLAASTTYSGDRVLFKMKDDPRRTRMGRWLRRTSLDEWPNFFNVLRGEMSIVGPRPHVPEEVAQYEPWQEKRLAITPGLTCLWQVHGRSNLTFDEQVRLDLYYAEHWSLWLDVKIILDTIPAVITGRGAY